MASLPSSELEVSYITVTSIRAVGLSAYASCAVLLGMYNSPYYYNDELSFAGQPAGDTRYSSTFTPIASDTNNFGDFSSMAVSCTFRSTTPCDDS